MSLFQELLEDDLPSKSYNMNESPEEDDFLESLFEAGDEDEEETDDEGDDNDDEEEDEDDASSDNLQEVADILEDIDELDLSKKALKDFASGKETSIEVSVDNAKKVAKKVESELEDYENITVSVDDGKVVIATEAADDYDEFLESLFEAGDDDECADDEEEGSEFEEEYDELDAILGDKSDDDIDEELSQIDPDDPDGDPDDEEDDIDEEPEEELDEIEDKRADDMLAMAATPMIIKDELTAEESVNFFESTDADIAVSEGLLHDTSLDHMYTEGVFASPNRPFKMTKQARLKQLYELSVQIEARAHHDPLMVRLDKAYSIERKIKKKLRAKYHSQAKRRSLIYLRRLMKSKSGVLKSIGKKIGIK